jgi:hypothetical protein
LVAARADRAFNETPQATADDPKIAVRRNARRETFRTRFLYARDP